MNKILPREFYLCEDVVQIAQELLGKMLFTKVRGQLTGGKIVEAEAYGGKMDRASHAFGNRRTARTESMFLPGGHAYVYLCYGVHRLFNVVTGPKDCASAVLIRAIEPMIGVKTMLRRRNIKKMASKLTAGPGALTQALGITLKHDRADLCNGLLWIADAPPIQQINILASPRVGVHYAGDDAKLHWRFRIKNSPWTSPAK
ncbi:MAG: DNA-3-methyladenine glycosylase [Verrucomicrobiota bacterium]